MNRRSWLALGGAGVTLAAGWTGWRAQKWKELSGNLAGIEWRIVWRAGGGLGSIETEIGRALDRVQSVFSPWRPNSEANRWNADHSESRSEAFLKGAEIALQLSRLTDGAFDITSRPGVPGVWRKLAIHEAERQLSAPEEARCDFSALHEGLLIQELADCLKRSGSEQFLVEFGGEFFAQGADRRGKDGWSILWEEPRPDITAAGNVEVTLKDEAFSVSGNYRRGVRSGENVHLWDGRTGAPVEAERFFSVGVRAGSPVLADGFATACAVLGEERGAALAGAAGCHVRFLYGSHRKPLF